MERQESGVDMEFDKSSDDTTPKKIIVMPFYNPAATGANDKVCRVKSTPCHQESQPTLKSALVTNRTQLKQQISREYVREEEKREKGLTLESIPEGTVSDFNVRVPTVEIPVPFSVLHKIFNVKTPLENPTLYHLNAVKNSQFRGYVQSKLQTNVEGLLLDSCAVGETVESDIANNSGPTVLETQTEEWTSESETYENELLEDILSLEEGQKHGHVAVLAPEAEENLMETLKYSASCPVLLGNESKEQKERRRKDNHNKIERKRRDGIKHLLEHLAELVPSSTSPTQKRNKGSLLKDTCCYIPKLEGEILILRAKLEENKVLKEENKNLMLKIQSMEMELQEKNIPVENPVWRTANPNELQAKMETSPDAVAYNIEEVAAQNDEVVITDQITNWLQDTNMEEEGGDYEAAVTADQATVPDLAAMSDVIQNICAELQIEPDNLLNGDPMLSSPHLRDSDI